jgi:FtsZ-binding cell division protein ZapB
MQELEGRFNEAYSQSLSMKDERIQVLERRIDDLVSDNEQLKDEASLLKRQNERIQRKNSASNSPSTSFSRSYSPRELHRLREEAAKSRELGQAVGLLQQEVCLSPSLSFPPLTLVFTTSSLVLYTAEALCTVYALTVWNVS